MNVTSFEAENLGFGEAELAKINALLLDALKKRTTGPVSFFSPERQICWCAQLVDGLCTGWVIVPCTSERIGDLVARVLISALAHTARVILPAANVAQQALTRASKGSPGG